MSGQQSGGAEVFTQERRLLEIETELGKDAVLLVEVDGEDRLSRGYVFHIEIATRLGDSAIRALLGKPVTLWLHDLTLTERRPIHGLLRRLTRRYSTRRDFNLWRAEVVPWFWFLSCTADCRIFQDLSVPDIIRKVLDGYPGANYEIRGLLGTYPKLEYCVQYRESTFDFLSRLMEHAGLFYWYEHHPSRHVLVISDNNTMVPQAQAGQVSYVTDSNHREVVEEFEQDFHFRPGKWVLKDFDFENPSSDLSVDAPTRLEVARMSDHEVYDYPGLYTQRGDGSTLARLRIEEEEAQHHRIQARAATPSFDAGRRITLGLERESYLVTAVHHHASDRSHWSNDAVDRPRYLNTFTAIPAKVPFRASRITPKPRVLGPQTATVTGPAGEEIHTDKYGRVKLRFHWDRNPDGKPDEQSSCWVRVAQVWAGKGWGAIHIPRIGQEVVVDFLEGDPDRPLITGRVYNGENPVPYDLPAKASQSGLISNSTKGGGGSNELRFEDAKGSEQVWFHAQKDLDSKIENNETREVGNDRTTTIHNNETTTVDANKTTTVKGDFKEDVLGTETRTVVGNVSETFAANETRMVGGSMTETIGGSLTQTVTGGITISTPGAITIAAGGGWSLVAPAGTRTVDSFFEKTGNKDGYSFAVKFSMNLTETKIVPGIATAIINNKIDIVSMKVDKSLTFFKSNGTELKTVGQIIKTGYMNLHTFGLVVWT